MTDNTQMLMIASVTISLIFLAVYLLVDRKPKCQCGSSEGFDGSGDTAPTGFSCESCGRSSSVPSLVAVPDFRFDQDSMGGSYAWNRMSGMVNPPYKSPPSALTGKFSALVMGSGLSSTVLSCLPADRYDTDIMTLTNQLPSPAVCTVGPAPPGSISLFTVSFSPNGVVTLTGNDGGMLGTSVDGKMVYVRPPGSLFGKVNFFWEIGPKGVLLSTDPNFQGFGIGGKLSALELVPEHQLSFVFTAVK